MTAGEPGDGQGVLLFVWLLRRVQGRRAMCCAWCGWSLPRARRLPMAIPSHSPLASSPAQRPGKGCKPRHAHWGRTQATPLQWPSCATPSASASWPCWRAASLASQVGCGAHMPLRRMWRQRRQAAAGVVERALPPIRTRSTTPSHARPQRGVQRSCCRPWAARAGTLTSPSMPSTGAPRRREQPLPARFAAACFAMACAAAPCDTTSARSGCTDPQRLAA